MIYLRLQAIVLVLVGLVELMAFPSAVMSREWMQRGHAWLGMGEMPEGPVFEAVMRQVSFVYGLHGISLLVMATDVVRYRPLLVLMSLGSLAYAGTMLLTDMALGMPRTWVLGNSGSTLLIGVLLGVLLIASRRQEERDLGTGARDL